PRNTASRALTHHHPPPGSFLHPPRQANPHERVRELRDPRLADATRTPAMIARSTTLTAALLVAVVVVSTAMPARRSGGPPASIASIGDSITAGTCTDPTCAERP